MPRDDRGAAALEGVMETLWLWRVAGGVRNFAIMVAKVGKKDDEFIRYSCIGIAVATQLVIQSAILQGKLPKVQSLLIRRRNVDGFEHKEPE